MLIAHTCEHTACDKKDFRYVVGMHVTPGISLCSAYAALKSTAGLDVRLLLWFPPLEFLPVLLGQAHTFQRTKHRSMLGKLMCCHLCAELCLDACADTSLFSHPLFFDYIHRANCVNT